MWAMTPEKVRCHVQGDERCNISYRCLTDSSGGQRKGRRQGQIGSMMALKDWEPMCHSPKALISPSLQRGKKTTSRPQSDILCLCSQQVFHTLECKLSVKEKGSYSFFKKWLHNSDCVIISINQSATKLFSIYNLI